MSNLQREQLLRERELRFFGTVTASISHELNNAMAIIEQAAGLLEDLLISEDSGTPPSKETLERIVDRIGRQTTRGAAMIRRLNAFAHSVDDQTREIDLNALAENVVELAHRLTEQKSIRLETKWSEAPLKIRNSSFRVQEAIFLSIQHASSRMGHGGRIMVTTSSVPGAAKVTLESEPTQAGNGRGDPYLELLMGTLGGEILFLTSPGAVTLELTFPQMT